MKKKFSLLLSFVFMVIGGIKASENRGEVIFDKYIPNHVSASNMTNINNVSDNKNFILEIIEKYHTKDPYELDEISIHNLSGREITEASKVLISAAVYGHNDIQAFLSDIDYKSLDYLDSIRPQSNEAIEYYTDTLLPKVEEHFIRQLRNSNNHHNIAVNLPIESQKKEKSLTFNSIN